METVGRLRSSTHGVRRASQFVSRVDRWRGLELTSARKRLQLARSLDGVVHELRGPVRLPCASLLGERLADLDRPVTESGMRAVHRLVTDGGGPLYDRFAEGQIPVVLAAVFGLLEPR